MDILVDGVKVKCRVDTGADVTVIPKDSQARVGKTTKDGCHCASIRTHRMVCTYGGSAENQWRGAYLC